MSNPAQFLRALLRPLGRRARVLRYRAAGLNVGVSSRIHGRFSFQGKQCIHIGARSTILPNAIFHALRCYAHRTYRPQIVIGDDVYIGRNAYFVAIDSISIGDGCVLSDFVYITDNAHGLHPEAGPLMKQPLQSKGPVRIGKNTFIGYRATILDGVDIGDHCIIGAHAVVTRSVPAYSMVAGVPGRVIKTFSREQNAWVPATDARFSEQAQLK